VPCGEEGQRRYNASHRRQGECHSQSYRIRQRAGDERSRGQSEQVLKQRQHRCSGRPNAGMDDPNHDRSSRSDRAGGDETTQYDQAELGARSQREAPMSGAKGENEEDRCQHAQGRDRDELAGGPTEAGSIGNSPNTTLPTAPARTTTAA